MVVVRAANPSSFSSRAEPRASTSRAGEARVPGPWGVPSADETPTGELLGNYRLLGRLGLGERCSIQRACPLFGQATDVAIKRLRDPQQRAARAWLLREARIGLGIRDRHLVRVLELHDEPEPFMVMPLVEGATLEQLLAREPGVDALRFVLPMLVDVLQGLSALHQWRNEQGAPSYLVHQAVRARHMLAGDDGVTRLIDLSHAHGAGFGPGSPLPQDNPALLAPEQFDTSQGLDPRCDVFLMGVALHDALTRLGAGPNSTWAGLYAVAERARSAKRSARFWSAEEMAYSLQNAAIETGVFASRAAVGAWVQAMRAGVTPDASRGSGLRLKIHASLPSDADADDEEPGIDAKTTAWERPLDRAALPADLQALLQLQPPLVTITPAAAEPSLVPARPIAAAPASAASGVATLPARRSPAPSVPPELLREAPASGALRHWCGPLALLALAVTGAVVTLLEAREAESAARQAPAAMAEPTPAPSAATPALAQPPASDVVQAAPAPAQPHAPAAPQERAETRRARDPVPASGHEHATPPTRPAATRAAAPSLPQNPY